MPIRVAILGTGRVCSYALLKPARDHADVQVTTVASRSAERADAFARRHQIGTAVTGYQAALDREDVDAVYIALPIALHSHWTQQALAAGKHVLCEKPLAANAGQAAALAELAASGDRVLMEAMHYRYHPLMARLPAWLQAIGPVRTMQSRLCIFWAGRRDFRFDYEMAGGALMDAGCYTVNLVRYATGGEPNVVAARSRLFGSRVDKWTRAELQCGEVRAVVECGLRSPPWKWRMSFHAEGEAGSLSILNPFAPHAFHRVTLRQRGRTERMRIKGPTTYRAQLDAFSNAVLRGEPVVTGAAEAAANQRVVDAIYEAAGLPIRGSESILGGTG